MGREVVAAADGSARRLILVTAPRLRQSEESSRNPAFFLAIHAMDSGSFFSGGN
jgi:hypothetical protein